VQGAKGEMIPFLLRVGTDGDVFVSLVLFFFFVQGHAGSGSHLTFLLHFSFPCGGAVRVHRKAGVRTVALDRTSGH
jgi:hypothetical protein